MRGCCATTLPDASARYRPRLVVMVKAPRPGLVKTRLGREIGMVEAAWWMRHQLHRLMRELRDPRWQLSLAVAPDAAISAPDWPSDLPKQPQGSGDLGARMARAFRRAPPGPVCIVGADIPGLRRRHVAQAFRALGQADAVIGPAPDGGYWLIGFGATAPLPATLFHGVRWSTRHARADTVANLRGHRIAYLQELADVDDAADLVRLR